MIKFVIGLMIGVCIGYILYKPKIKYNKETHTLDPKGLDTESVQSLIEFIDACLQIRKSGNLKNNKK